ncbi:MAG: hypothetical protein M9962_14450 [Oligoflexia bacterium]|nr:hypothetical protein [Oligoflexia bacterium]
MSEIVSTKKGHIRCNACKENCTVKNGDWFFPTKSSNTQQIFLCKKCETQLKNVYSRVSQAR